MMNKNLSILIKEEDIQKRISELGAEISSYFEKILNNEELHILWVAEGGLFFAADLARRITVPITLSSILSSSYKNSTEAMCVPQIKGDFSCLKGKNVLIVDDILDKGKTIEAILEAANTFAPKKVLTCFLLDKK